MFGSLALRRNDNALLVCVCLQDINGVGAGQGVGWGWGSVVHGQVSLEFAHGVTLFEATW